MSRGKVTLIFFIFCWSVLSTLVVPPIFQYFNRIEPRVFGIPFLAYWILLVCIILSLTLIVWYIVEDKRGELD
ncbi:hypothetical protein AU377_03235 [Sporosarcina sp. HYO08]|nr:hypothetical protein AU377_03235 [Sporosarcina sp. HYO08]